MWICHELASWLGLSWKSFMHCWTISYNAGVITTRQEMTIFSIIDVWSGFDGSGCTVLDDGSSYDDTIVALVRFLRFCLLAILCKWHEIKNEVSIKNCRHNIAMLTRILGGRKKNIIMWNYADIPSEHIIERIK